MELFIEPRFRPSPLEVLETRFRLVRRGRGYDQREVDEFLDRVVWVLIRLHQLREQQPLPPAEPAVDLPEPAATPTDEALEGARLLDQVPEVVLRCAEATIADALARSRQILQIAYQQAAAVRADATAETPASPAEPATGSGAVELLAGPGASAPAQRQEPPIPSQTAHAAEIVLPGWGPANGERP